MAEYAVMPFADYQDACDAIREKDGTTAVIKSGDMGAKIRAIETGGGATDPPCLFKLEVPYNKNDWNPGETREFAADCFPGLEISTKTNQFSNPAFYGNFHLKNTTTNEIWYCSINGGNWLSIISSATGEENIDLHMIDIFTDIEFNTPRSIQNGTLTPDHLSLKNKTTEWIVFFMDVIGYLPGGYVPNM